MDLPIDTSTLHCVVTEPCAPRTDRETGQQRTDRATGRGIWDTGLLVGDGTQATPLRVKTFSANDAPQMTPVTVTGLRLTMLTINGDVVQYFTAEEIRPAAAGEWGPAPASAPASGTGSAPASAAEKGAASSSAGAGSGGSAGGSVSSSAGGSAGSRSGGSAGKAGA